MFSFVMLLQPIDVITYGRYFGRPARLPTTVCGQGEAHCRRSSMEWLANHVKEDFFLYADQLFCTAAFSQRIKAEKHNCSELVTTNSQLLMRPRPYQ